MTRKQKHHAGLIRTRSSSGFGRGFTLIELLVVVSVIAVLAALVISALNRAVKSSKRVAGQRSAAALVQAVEQFENQFGFLPPLVHDGIALSGGLDDYRPQLIPDVWGANTTQVDGPLVDKDLDGRVFYTVVTWSEGLDLHFLRRRTGSGQDDIDFSNGTNAAWWEDRRYSKYSLAYYLTGVLDRDVDGVRGPGFARPNIDGTYLGVGYPGATRDRFEPLIDVDRKGVRVAIDYIEPREYPEHLLDGSEPPSQADVYSDYPDLQNAGDQRKALVSLVDSFGNAYRYYRWEQGRFENGRLVVENLLDFNIPPILIDPVVLGQVEYNTANLKLAEFTSGNINLRKARFAVVSAGPDGLFGTESIETIAEFFRLASPPTDIIEIAQLRHDVWADNAVGVGN